MSPLSWLGEGSLCSDRIWLSFNSQSRAGHPLHHRRHVLDSAAGTCEHIEVFKATQGKQHIHHLVEALLRRASVSLHEPPEKYTQSGPSSLVARPNHLLE